MIISCLLLLWMEPLTVNTVTDSFNTQELPWLPCTLHTHTHTHTHSEEAEARSLTHTQTASRKSQGHFLFLYLSKFFITINCRPHNPQFPLVLISDYQRAPVESSGSTVTDRLTVLSTYYQPGWSQQSESRKFTGLFYSLLENEPFSRHFFPSATTGKTKGPINYVHKAAILLINHAQDRK